MLRNKGARGDWRGGVKIVRFRLSTLIIGAVGLMIAQPAMAQFFFKNPDVSGAPVRGDEPGLTIALPGATPAETRAGLVWSLRAGLNVAALRCQFAPELLVVSYYNAVLVDHADELKAAVDTLSKYYARKAGKRGGAQAGFDQYGTRLYSLFSNAASQYLFCQTAATIGYAAITAPRGRLYAAAENRMREFRNGMKPLGEQAFPGRLGINFAEATILSLDPACWDRYGRYDYRICPRR